MLHLLSQLFLERIIVRKIKQRHFVSILSGSRPLLQVYLHTLNLYKGILILKLFFCYLDGELWRLGRGVQGTILAICPDEADPKSVKHKAAVLSGIRLTSQGHTGGQDTIRFHCVAPAFPSGQKDAIIKMGNVKFFETERKDAIGGANFLDRHPVMCPYNHFLSSLEGYGRAKTVRSRRVTFYTFYDGGLNRIKQECNELKTCRDQLPHKCYCEPGYEEKKYRNEEYVSPNTGSILLYIYIFSYLIENTCL